ncbi:hypothetical protein SETIT_9G253600v2 [Setaria italica]|uniref:Uncharacterized protein n=2 Tax=Setaria TaxID=4554 RepID=A0A368SKN9_SETIT|nr:hypothetical protein SETIT_9G253600v2 [Setaria italica]TKV93850.1 hypothetical protein SEVIR_9G256300v2 [Setaria viridis]
MGSRKWRPWMLVRKLRSLKRERKWLSFNRFMMALICAWGLSSRLGSFESALSLNLASTVSYPWSI